MARKGTATVKTANKGERYIYLDSDDEKIDPTSTTPDESQTIKSSSPAKEQGQANTLENGHLNATREQLNLSWPPKPNPELPQPRQASTAVDRSKTLAKSLFSSTDNKEKLQASQDFDPPTLLPSKTICSQNQLSIRESRPRIKTSATPHSLAAAFRTADANRPINLQNLEETDEMAIQGGAAIPANQQRNMRACMVCSIVRTQQQFMTGGCPNCEDILELAGNSEQINDCTSQVFDGLISVADTKRSWVARYQRLEGYVPGVYATQVEGILPEDVIVAVENAGINYVPRDGSEQDMLPKD
ncbi:Spt4/RpoE2 zinc finger-domain-containing protein [Pyrenochaeta sp. MPI-SDFR-AT-0127]|nr:Spt4/RpoE2 zinc finger-domain-containing protein [Pyrenochaeta sp. MPI-SDFR-AT-0127]